MRFLALALLVASPAVFAQARGGGGHAVGVVRAPVHVPPAPPVHASPAPVSRPVARPVVPVVVPYPVYVGGYYANPYYYGSGYATAPTPDYGPAPAYYDTDPSNTQASNSQSYATQGYPGVIVNPNYVPETSNPALHDYTNLPPPDAVTQDQDTAASPVIFLIAMTDHTIYPAVAYWVEDDTLNYITQQGVRNRVSLDLVDRAFSTQLNKERSIDFGLPPARDFGLPPAK